MSASNPSTGSPETATCRSRFRTIRATRSTVSIRTTIPPSSISTCLGTPGGSSRAPIYLDARADGKATGGVAKPNALLSVMSRAKGPVGGRNSAPSSSTSPVANVPAEPAAPPYASALSGRFDPIEYFGAALGEAKLLGVVALKDILRAVAISEAPQLTEQVQYQVNAAEKSVSQGIDDAFKGLKKDVLPFLLSERLKLNDFMLMYPRLVLAWDILSDSSRMCRAGIQAATRTPFCATGFSSRPNSWATSRTFWPSCAASRATQCPRTRKRRSPRSRRPGTRSKICANPAGSSRYCSAS